MWGRLTQLFVLEECRMEYKENLLRRQDTWAQKKTVKKIFDSVQQKIFYIQPSLLKPSWICQEIFEVSKWFYTLLSSNATGSKNAIKDTNFRSIKSILILTELFNFYKMSPCHTSPRCSPPARARCRGCRTRPPPSPGPRSSSEAR